MPNTKEKLIEVLDEANLKLKELCGGLNEHNGNGVRADHLIANGVTFAEGNNVLNKWIPVTERLPEDDLPTDTKRLQIKVLVTTNHKGKKFVRVITRERWEFPVGNMRPWIWSKDATNVTHWMPLPEPPKGE